MMGKDFSGQRAAAKKDTLFHDASASAAAPGVIVLPAAGVALPVGWEKPWTDAGWTVAHSVGLQQASIVLHAPRVVAGEPVAPSKLKAVPGKKAVADDAAGGRTIVPRSVFLCQLSDEMGRPEHGCRTLLSIRVDQASALAEQVDRTVMFSLEEQICARIVPLLQGRDAMTIWLELGFGVLVQRDDSRPVIDLARRICARVAAEPFVVAGVSHELTVSVGLALSPRGPIVEGAHPWFASAYAAQALAYRHGGNRFDGLLTREFEPMPADRVMIIREWVQEAKSGGNVLIEYRAIMPMRPRCAPLYYMHAKLRDMRAPLGGVYRREYLRLAREAGAMVAIDRLSLFHAFQTLEQEQEQGRDTRLLVPVEMATLRGMPWCWLEAELVHRAHVADRLMIELDASSMLDGDDAMSSMVQLRKHGVRICLTAESADLAHAAAWAASPAEFLRVAAPVVEGMSHDAFAADVSMWRAPDKHLIIDGVDDFRTMARLDALGIDYLGGDAIAAIGPRLDHRFATPV